jgi:hypothetical protein
VDTQCPPARNAPLELQYPQRCTPHNSTTISPIDAAIEEIKSLAPGEKFSYRKIAEKYGVEQTTLARRHQAKNQPRLVKSLQQRAVTPAQEQELILYINKQCEAGIPPPKNIVQGWASTLAGKGVSLRWVSRFLHRQQDQLVLRSTTGIDRSRHKADSEVKYDLYFKFWHSKMAEYSIKPDQIYNMDEKGLLMERTTRTHRVFSRAMWDRGELQAALQDGSREWITTLATICADGTALAPSLVYSSDASAVSSKDHTPTSKSTATVKTTAITTEIVTTLTTIVNTVTMASVAISYIRLCNCLDQCACFHRSNCEATSAISDLIFLCKNPINKLVAAELTRRLRFLFPITGPDDSQLCACNKGA